MRKLVAICIAVMLAITVSNEAASSPPGAAKLFSLANSARARMALPLLRYDSDLHHVAVAAVIWMAANHQIKDPNPPCFYGGSNAGVGVSVRKLHRAFMLSADHKRNILDPHYTHAATATRRDERGQLWVAEVFCAG